MDFLIPSKNQLDVRSEYISGKRVAKRPVFTKSKSHYKKKSKRLLTTNITNKTLEFVDA